MIKEIKRKKVTNYILECAKEVFTEKGYLETKMSDIALHCNMATGTLYNYFENKEDLFVKIVENTTDELFNLLKEAGKDIEDPIDILKTKINFLLKFVDKNHKFFLMIHKFGTSFMWQIKLRLSQNIHSRLLTSLSFTEEPIKRAIAEGKIRNLNPQLLSIYLFGIVNSFMFGWLEMPEKYKIKKNTVDEIFKLFLDGAGVKK